MEAFEVFPNPDLAWDDYLRNGDCDVLGAKHALVFRSTFAPSLASALDASRTAEELRAFAESLESAVKRIRAKQPMPLDIMTQVIVLAKRTSCES